MSANTCKKGQLVNWKILFFLGNNNFAFMCFALFACTSFPSGFEDFLVCDSV